MRFLNRKARFNYEIIDEYTAGLVLVGSEVKSIRSGKVNFTDSFISINDGVPKIKNLHISKYEMSSYLNHEETRDRIILLNKREIKKISDSVSQKGLTIIPLEIFLSKGFFKVKIGVCRGKKNWDKKNTIKERDIKMDMLRSI